MKVKLKTPNGESQILEFDNKLTFSELQSLVSLKTNIKNPILILGYPPKEITGSPKDTVEKLGIKHGEQIQIKTGQGVVKGKVSGVYVPPIDPKGSLQVRKMPGDNSCCFHSLAYILHDKNTQKGPELRDLAAQLIASDPKTYNEGILGMKNSSYVQHLLNPDTWGGAVEVRAMADFYQIEICLMDLQTGREDHFGIDKGYSRRGFLFYTGNHYDAMAYAKHGGSHPRDDQVLFNSKDDEIMKKARDFIKYENKELLKSKLLNN